MQDVADKIERSFSLNKTVNEEKIPELIKRKTSLQGALQAELGGIQKIREVKEQEWDRPQELFTGKTDDGESYEIKKPAAPKDRDAKKMEEFRQHSFNELYELEIPYESKPRRREEQT